MNTATIIETLRTLKRAAKHFDSSFAPLLGRFARLYCLEGYMRSEILGFGILDPRTPAERMRQVISRRRLKNLQLTINPAAYNYVTEDKGVFYPFCIGAEIPVPQLHAVFDRARGWTLDGQHLEGKEDWVGFVEDRMDDSFVVKPTWGVHGLSLYVMNRDGGCFVDFAGQRYSAAQLYDAIVDDPEFDRFIIQERIRNHPDLVALCDTAALQTTRVITVTDRSGVTEILFAVQKLIAGAGAADNFSWGRAGNLVAEVSLGEGRILNAVTGHESALRLKSVEAHPRTGRRLVDFQVPFWPEVCDLVVDAARKFLPIRTVGWDVAVTPDGPLILEGNMWWHPDHHNALLQTGKFLDYLERHR